MKKAGCTLEIIKKYMTLYDLGSKTVPERVNLLETQKKALIEAIEKLQESIDYLDYKIEHTKKH